ncbi:hypothetical protein NDU88_004024 [Pleurodeles waltl]|uniref:Uncharacterized protein n=1 Tax=Pleurodeles waltl TaxID=8319 RepID=A0AAV7M5Y9_PLEWA|nr:hypothetical protein NDU88_004024 [Pleurodeles waltl]
MQGDRQSQRWRGRERSEWEINNGSPQNVKLRNRTGALKSRANYTPNNMRLFRVSKLVAAQFVEHTGMRNNIRMIFAHSYVRTKHFCAVCARNLHQVLDAANQGANARFPPSLQFRFWAPTGVWHKHNGIIDTIAIKDKIGYTNRGKDKDTGQN